MYFSKRLLLNFWFHLPEAIIEIYDIKFLDLSLIILSFWLILSIVDLFRVLNTLLQTLIELISS